MSNTSSPAKQADFIVSGSGTVYLLIPVTEEAKAWVEENIAQNDETQYLGNGIAVEHRYICDIIDGIKAAGLTLNR